VSSRHFDELANREMDGELTPAELRELDALCAAATNQLLASVDRLRRSEGRTPAEAADFLVRHLKRGETHDRALHATHAD
jgi:hypothetical protein